MDEYRVGTEPHSVSPDEAEFACELLAAETRRSKAKSAWQGAKTGFRWASYVAAPFVVIAVSVGLAISALGVGSGRGWGVHLSLSRGVLFYFVCLPWGMIPGALIGWFTALGRLAPEGTRRSKLSAVVERPIHPLRWLRWKRPADAAETPPRQPRRRLWPWLIAVPMVVATVTGFVTGGHLGRIIDRRLADAEAMADRDDPAWRLEDLLANREDVPDEENSALIVVDAASRMPERWPVGPEPLAGEPKPPATEASQAFDRMRATKPNVCLDDETVDTLRGELERYEAAVVLARSVANYPRGRPALVLEPALYDTYLAGPRAARDAAQLLVADAAIRAQDGDIDGALDSSRALLCVGRSIGDEPFAPSQLVRVAVGNSAMKSVRRTLGKGEASDGSLARLQSLVIDEFGQPLLVYLLNGERATNFELIRRISAGEVPVTALRYVGASSVADFGLSGTDPWTKLWFDNQRAVLSEWMLEMIAIARQPTPDRPRLWKAWEAEIERVRSSELGIRRAPVPFIMMAVLDLADTSISRLQAELGATVILLAAERHRLKTGDWPESIEAIDPNILPSPPRDPFTGGPFHMERRDGQLLVYSIGPNLKDQHGAFDPKLWLKGGPDDVGTGAWDVKLRGQIPAVGEADAPGETEAPRP